MRLRKLERCPIHNQYYCCGRELGQTERKSKPRFRAAVERIPDDHHPRGYIEHCSKPEMRRRLSLKLQQQSGICAICNKLIDDVREAVLDHREPRPMGCKKDDHMDNLQAAHSLCNMEKGSKRIE